jgi:hypothetical protein
MQPSKGFSVRAFKGPTLSSHPYSATAKFDNGYRSSSHSDPRQRSSWRSSRYKDENKSYLDRRDLPLCSWTFDFGLHSLTVHQPTPAFPSENSPALVSTPALLWTPIYTNAPFLRNPITMPPTVRIPPLNQSFLPLHSFRAHSPATALKLYKVPWTWTVCRTYRSLIPHPYLPNHLTPNNRHRWLATNRYRLAQPTVTSTILYLLGRSGPSLARLFSRVRAYHLPRMWVSCHPMGIAQKALAHLSIGHRLL